MTHRAEVPNSLTVLRLLLAFVALLWQSVPVWLTIATALLSAAAAVDYVRFNLCDVRQPAQS